MQSEVRKTYQLLFDDLENDFDGFDGFELSPGFVIVISIIIHTFNYDLLFTGLLLTRQQMKLLSKRWSRKLAVTTQSFSLLIFEVETKVYDCIHVRFLPF